MQTWKTDDFTAIMRNHAYFSKLQGYIASAIANTEGDNNFAVILRNSDLKLSSNMEGDMYRFFRSHYAKLCNHCL